MNGEIFDRQLPLWPHIVPNYGRCLYFVECGAFVKIGYTARPVHNRMSEFETGNPEKLKLIGTLTIRDDEDDRDLHVQLRKFHHKKEWFHKTDELMAIIADLLNGPEQRCTLQLHGTVDPETVFAPWVDCPFCGQAIGVFFKLDLTAVPPYDIRAIVTHPREQPGWARNAEYLIAELMERPPRSVEGCGRRFRLTVHVTA